MAGWPELSSKFGDFIGLSVAERDGRLAELATTDPALVDELSSLLKAHDRADDFFEEKIPRLFASLAPKLPLSFQAGEQLLHFKILELLGEGSCGVVYLAQDEELDRLVALKVCIGETAEARHLATFQLDGIVQVYSEHVLHREGVRLHVLCLQFIAGPTLESVLLTLRKYPGVDFLSAIEKAGIREVALEPAAFKWRELIANSTTLETLVLLGIRLSEVLHHAHGCGILHLDVKPANILIDAFGRPFLSDFNISSDHLASSPIGGTPRYMSPEQIQFFETAQAPALDARADVYALGVLLRETLIAVNLDDASLSLIIERATCADRMHRLKSAEQLSRELGAWLRGHLAEKDMPPLRSVFSWVIPHPFLALISLTVVSQLIAASINISYNRLQIVATLTLEQRAVFFHSVALYNLFVYPGLIVFSAYVLRELYRSPLNAERARRTVLRLPALVLFVVSVGWLPGTYLIPWTIDLYAGPLDAWIYWRFAGSFWLGWLVSTTTSLTVVLFILTRVLYPKFWCGENGLARTELRPCERWNRLLPFLAALFPMCGVLFMVLFAPDEFSAMSFRPFKILLLLTLGLGLINLFVVQRLTAQTEIALRALKRKRAFD